MTLDDDNSVYVGGLPFDVTEDSIRRAFNLYGAVVDVKIVNERALGKCYCFVTFTNPRSAIDAINDMNGRTIGGRVVNVNEVKPRVGRMNNNRESFRRYSDRDIDRGRGKGRERSNDRDRDRYRNRDRDRSNDRDRTLDRDRDRDRTLDRDRDRDQDRERGNGRVRDARDRDQFRERTKDRVVDRDRDDERDEEHNEQENNGEHDRKYERERDDLDLDREKEIDRANERDESVDKDKDEESKKNYISSNYDDQRSRELSSESTDDYRDEVKEQLEISIQRREELQTEISHMEEKLDVKEKFVSGLQKQSQKLENALSSAKKLSSHHKMHLTKLHKCFLQVQDYREKLKDTENELQSLADATMMELEVVDNDVGLRAGVLINGNA